MHLSEFDLNCRAIGEVDLGSDLWNIFDASPERGLLLLYWQHYHGVGSIEWELSAWDADTQKVRRHFPPLEDARFAEGGKTVCGVSGVEWRRTVECVDVDTGNQLAVSKGWQAPRIETATRAKRAILSDYSRKLDWIDGVWREGPLQKRTIWDFGARELLTSWRPKWQRAKLGVFSSTPYSCAISPDGDYLVEGGSGIVTLYKIEP